MVDKSKVLFLNSSFIKSTISDGKTDSITIEGYASTTDIDRQGDVVPVSVWEKGIQNYLKNPVILAYHDHSEPVSNRLGMLPCFTNSEKVDFRLSDRMQSSILRGL